jgi:hypothetical protein
MADLMSKPLSMSTATSEGPGIIKADRSLRPLRWSVALTWVGWLMTNGLLWGEYQFAVLHPYSLLFLFLLLLTVLPTLLNVTYGFWGLLRGPRRRRVAGLLAVGLTPALLWLALVGYGLRVLQRHDTSQGVLWGIMSQAMASVMELQLHYTSSYPHQLESEHLVMWCDDRVTSPERDLDAMDKHVARLMKMTGTPLRAKIYWVRGELASKSRMAIFGLALGNSTSPSDWESADHPDNLSVDRHELAHAVLHQRYQPDTDPPTLLVEGWADSQSGLKREKLAFFALHSRKLWIERTAAKQGASYLRELVSPNWYHHIDGPVYSVGGALSDYLLRTYGVEKFMQLYFTCKPGSFEADCRNVYGVDFDTLENAFWLEAERLVPDRPQ